MSTLLSRRQTIISCALLGILIVFLSGPSQLSLVLAGTGEMWEEIATENRRKLEQNRDDIQIHFNLAVAYANLGQIEVGMEHLEKADELDTNGKFARQIIERKRTKLEEDPDNLFYLNQLGFALYAEGEYEEASGIFERLCRLDPDNAWIRNYHALALMEQERYTESEEVVKESLSLDPDNEYSHFLLGTIYYKQGSYLRALLQLRHAPNLTKQFLNDYIE